MSDQIVSYKGNNYKLVWKGKTKYGERAKLAFLDNSKEFWVDASQIGSSSTSSSTSSSSSRSSPSRHRSGRCRDCGREIRDAPHHRAMGGLCGDCAFDEYDC